MEEAKYGTRYQTKQHEKKAGKEAETLEKETEEDGRMEEREITSVEDVEELLTPVEPDKPTQQEEARGGPDWNQFMELMSSMMKSMDKKLMRKWRNGERKIREN